MIRHELWVGVQFKSYQGAAILRWSEGQMAPDVSLYRVNLLSALGDGCVCFGGYCLCTIVHVSCVCMVWYCLTAYQVLHLSKLIPDYK